MNFVTYSTKLAKAGFAESAQTLDVLTTILNAYGLEADEVGRVSDMLIQTQNKGKVTVAELSSVMGKIIPTAKSNGVALEQITADTSARLFPPFAASSCRMFNTSLRLLPSAISSLKPFPAAARSALSAVVPDFPSSFSILFMYVVDSAAAIPLLVMIA